MLSVLIEGTLIAAPVQRTSQKGTAYATAQMRAAGEDGESIFCSVIAFQTEAVEALVRLGTGDAVAVAGPACLSQWEKNGEHKVGLRITATRVLSVYDAGMRRKAASGDGQAREGRATARASSPQRGRYDRPREAPARAGALADWDDDLPA